MQPSAVFVYGTLKRGQCRERMWPVKPRGVQECFVHGRLFHRADYPALRAGDDRVLGELWSIADADTDTVLRTLDRIEGYHQRDDDLYHRVIVGVFDLRGEKITDAYTYYYASDPALDGFTLMLPRPCGYVVWPATE